MKQLSAAVVLVATMLAAQVALADGQSVSTNEWKTDLTGEKCAVQASAAFTGGGFKHVTSGNVHKSGTVVLYADQGAYQATVFCLTNHIAVEVTGPTDQKASSLIDAFTKAWDSQ
ncbi:MAG: hypothetical protein JO009_08515 [Candidatus Eremiobacteraeota bacterium]|nr:hypothetical protein [Candidatus Eremiobacteraeota bacterium]